MENFADEEEEMLPDEAFGEPEVILSMGIENVLEAPTISSCGKELFYHKKVPAENKYKIYTLTRDDSDEGCGSESVPVCGAPKEKRT